MCRAMGVLGDTRPAEGFGVEQGSISWPHRNVPIAPQCEGCWPLSRAQDSFLCFPSETVDLGF